MRRFHDRVFDNYGLTLSVPSPRIRITAVAEKASRCASVRLLPSTNSSPVPDSESYSSGYLIDSLRTRIEILLKKKAKIFLGTDNTVVVIGVREVSAANFCHLCSSPMADHQLTRDTGF